MTIAFHAKANYHPKTLAYCFDKLTSEVMSMNSITPGWIEVRGLTARLDIVIEFIDMTSDVSLSKQYANEDAFGMIFAEANSHLG
jgi:hypothetical protein